MQWHKERSAVLLYDVHAFKDAVSRDMSQVEEPNGPARAFEAKNEQMEEIFEQVVTDAMDALKREHERLVQAEDARDYDQKEARKINNNLQHLITNLKNDLQGTNQDLLKELNHLTSELKEYQVEFNKICPICQERQVQVVLISNPFNPEAPCGHTYCRTCIDTWWTTRQTCPQCRETCRRVELF